MPIFLDIFKEHPIPSFGPSLRKRRRSFSFSPPFCYICDQMQKIKTFLKNAGLRALRFLGIILVIYISMVFYLALTERRNAFPRAIYHKEANEAIQNKAKPLTCTLEDGVVLNGFSLGNENAPVMLYFAEADEDAAQFLAQIDSLPGFNVITFNYRGSAQNKGTPSEDNFMSDARQIFECATQVNGNAPKILTGHGTGAIPAAEFMDNGRTLFLIDPILDIAESISQKYRALYPKFLVRTGLKADTDKLSRFSDNIYFLYDRKSSEEQTRNTAKALAHRQDLYRNGEHLSTIILQAINKNLSP